MDTEELTRVLELVAAGDLSVADADALIAAMDGVMSARAEPAWAAPVPPVPPVPPRPPVPPMPPDGPRSAEKDLERSGWRCPDHPGPHVRHGPHGRSEWLAGPAAATSS